MNRRIDYQRLNYAQTNDDATDAQLYSEQTREIANEQEQQAQERAEFESYHTGVQVDLGFKHGNAMSRLETAQQERDGDYKQSLVDQNQQLENDLQAQGMRKLWRDFTGRSDNDRAQLEAVQRSFESMKQREQNEVEQLQATHVQQEQARQDDMQQRAAYVAERQQEINDARTTQQREQIAETQQSVEPANTNEAPKHQERGLEAAPEQDNGQSNQFDFDAAARAAYVEERQQEGAAQPSPSHEFEQAAPAPSRGHER